jgi:hypothetical protein
MELFRRRLPLTCASFQNLLLPMLRYRFAVFAARLTFRLHDSHRIARLVSGLQLPISTSRAIRKNPHKSLF